MLSPGSVKKAMSVGGATGVRYGPAAAEAGANPARCCCSDRESVQGERLAWAEMITADEESSIIMDDVSV